MSVDVKCDFAELKYQQLLSDKYFVETCFSKKYDSYSMKDKLIDMFFFMKTQSNLAVTSTDGIDCLI